MFSILAIYNNEISPNSIHYFAKVGSKIFPKLNKPSKNCPSVLNFAKMAKFRHIRSHWWWCTTVHKLCLLHSFFFRVYFQVRVLINDENYWTRMEHVWGIQQHQQQQQNIFLFVFLLRLNFFTWSVKNRLRGFEILKLNQLYSKWLCSKFVYWGF